MLLACHAWEHAVSQRSNKIQTSTDKTQCSSLAAPENLLSVSAPTEYRSTQEQLETKSFWTAGKGSIQWRGVEGGGGKVRTTGNQRFYVQIKTGTTGTKLLWTAGKSSLQWRGGGWRWEHLEARVIWTAGKSSIQWRDGWVGEGLTCIPCTRAYFGGKRSNRFLSARGITPVWGHSSACSSCRFVSGGYEKEKRKNYVSEGYEEITQAVTNTPHINWGKEATLVLRGIKFALVVCALNTLLKDGLAIAVWGVCPRVRWPYY